MASPSSSSSSISDRVRAVAVNFPTLTAGPASRSSAGSFFEPAASGVAATRLKFYQIKVQDLLYDYLDKTLAPRFAEDVGEQDTNGIEAIEDNVGFRLFRCAPPGISSACSRNEHPSKLRQREYWKNSSDEESDKFHTSLMAAAIDGDTVKAEADKAIARAFSFALAEEASAKEATRREEERVALLKQLRGEEWLPSIARQMSAGEVECRSMSVERTEFKGCIPYKYEQHHLKKKRKYK